MELMTERTSKHMELRIDRVSKQYRNKIAVDRFSATLHGGQDDTHAHDLRRPHADQRGDHI